MLCHALEVAATRRTLALEKQIKRFTKTTQRRLRKLARGSSRLGDLMYSFPAASYAIVSGHGNHESRAEAVRLVKEGAELGQVAQVLALPNWTRRLPPEAFTETLDALPAGSAFARVVPNLIPSDPDAAAMWLRWVQAGNRACHEDFALWLARQNVYSVQNDFGTPVVPLAIFAWVSGCEADHPARRRAQAPWRKQIGFRKAVIGMSWWFDQMLIDLTRAEQNRGPGRHRNKKRNGYQLVRLKTPAALVGEGEAMNHCVGTYVYDVLAGRCLIYSVRRKGHRVATLELRWVHGRHRPPVVNQLLGPSNQQVDAEVVRAVYGWLAEKSGTLTPVTRDIPLDDTRWRAFWGDYVDAKAAHKIVPAAPSSRFVYDMAQDILQLGRCVGVA